MLGGSLADAATLGGKKSRKVAVVLNPASGRGTGRRMRYRLEHALAAAWSELPELPDWRILETRGPGDGVVCARRAVDEGAQVVAAAGGDGTLCEVVNGLVGTDATLGVLPLGTGNDFARAVGLAGDIDLAARTLLHGEERLVDLGLVDGRYFINIAGCGLDAAVAARVNRGFRWLRGTSAYVAAVLQTLATYRAAPIRLTIDGKTVQMRAMLCCIANTESYGGGMRIAPDARIDDGLLNVCVLREAGIIEFLRAFPKVFHGTHVSHPKFWTGTAKDVVVESDRPLPVLIDGDVSHTTPLHVTVAPGALRVMLPAISDADTGG